MTRHNGGPLKEALSPKHFSKNAFGLGTWVLDITPTPPLIAGSSGGLEWRKIATPAILATDLGLFILVNTKLS